jgi:hypothetical protein
LCAVFSSLHLLQYSDVVFAYDNLNTIDQQKLVARLTLPIHDNKATRIATMSSRQNYITESHLLQTTYAMITLSSVFILARIVTTQLVRPKRFLPQDLIIYLAYILYLIMAFLYILVTPILFRLTAVGEKRLKPYPTLKDDHKFMVRVFFCNTLLFWCILWSVKLGFLMLYKKLMEGLHNVYIKLWWGVVGFWFLVR